MEIDPNNPTTDDEAVFNFDVGRYLSGLRKYVWAIVAIVALAVTAAVIYTNRQPKVYRAVASVQIEPRIPDLLGQRQDILSRATVGGMDYYAQQQDLCR